ncbi:MAG: SHD1 domain-containing protein [Verrucomicrobiota bacterium]
MSRRFRSLFPGPATGSPNDLHHESKFLAIFGAASFIVLILGLAHAAEVRTWTDIQGRKVEASLLRVEDKTVILKLKDGREIPYPLAKFSPDDCKYVAESRPQAATAKTTKTTKTAKTGEDGGNTLNFAAPWPELIKFSEDPEINVVEENADNKSFVYESANYRYVCDVRLNKSVVKGFAVLFEATYLYCRTLPLAINEGVRVDGKHPITLYKETDDYVKAGGPPGSAGFFISGRVMVPLSSLGVKPLGSSYMLDRNKNSTILSHELTHQLTPDAYFKNGALGWFSEGLAEYVANTPYRSGTFHVRGNQKDIVDYVTNHGSKDKGGRALGNKIKLPALKTFMLQSFETFLQTTQISYGSSLLLTTYFFHMDGEGDGKRVKAFLKALRDGADGEKALDSLLDGRSFDKLEQDITKAWSHKGVDFTFAKE